MPVSLAPPPYKTAIAGPSGILTTAWSGWIQNLFLRVGQMIALSNTELANQQTTELAAISAEIISLQASVDALEAELAGSSIQGQIEALNQAPVA